MFTLSGLQVSLPFGIKITTVPVLPGNVRGNRQQVGSQKLKNQFQNYVDEAWQQFKEARQSDRGAIDHAPLQKNIAIIKIIRVVKCIRKISSGACINPDHVN